MATGRQSTLLNCSKGLTLPTATLIQFSSLQTPFDMKIHTTNVLRKHKAEAKSLIQRNIIFGVAQYTLQELSTIQKAPMFFMESLGHPYDH
jgi:hypothetical protein